MFLIQSVFTKTGGTQLQRSLESRETLLLVIFIGDELHSTSHTSNLYSPVRQHMHRWCDFVERSVHILSHRDADTVMNSLVLT